MTNIYCTKKLEKLVGKKLLGQEEAQGNKLGNWNADVFHLQGKKCLILMNDITYYSLFFLDIRKVDLLKFSELFYARFIEQLDYDKIDFPVECSPALIAETTAQFLPTNNNRKVLGTMTDFLRAVEYFFHDKYHGQLSNIDVNELNHNYTNFLVGALSPKQGKYGKPIDEMKKKIEEICS
ncbi:MAG: hypothetical protein AAFO69_16170 [Bacteroidota bacterium]